MLDRSLPPGPGRFSVVQLHDWITTPCELLDACAARYGASFTLRFPFQRPLVVVSDPDDVRKLFSVGLRAIDAGCMNGMLEPVVGHHSPVVLDGARHLRIRRALAVPFGRAQVSGTLDALGRRTRAWLEDLPVGRAFPVHAAFEDLTLDGMLEDVLGLEPGPRTAAIRDGVRELLALLSRTTTTLTWMLVGRAPVFAALPAWRRVRRLLARLDAALASEIVSARERAARGEPPRGALDRLARPFEIGGDVLTPREIRDQLVTLLWAGCETTPNALAWAVHHLVENPAWIERIAIEATDAGAALPPPPGSDEAPDRRPVLEAVIRETLRSSPVITLAKRRLATDLDLGDRTLPAGTDVAACLYLAHRDPRRWPDPTRFDPGRFLAAERSNPFHFLPFGGGMRRCVGMHLALGEMRVVLAELCVRKRFRAAPGYRMRVARHTVAYLPSEGMPIVCDGERRGMERVS
ncbi:MAG: cytochrome P450 [bacterium]